MRFVRVAVAGVLLACLTSVPVAAHAGPAARGGDCAPEFVIADPNARQYEQAALGAVYTLRIEEEGPPRVRARLMRPWMPPTPEGPIARADIDGDGCDDLVVGSPHLSAGDHPGTPDLGYLPGEDGYVQIIWGGTPARGQMDATTVLRPPVRGRHGHFGWSVAAAAGVVAVGAPHEDAPGVPDAGAVHLFALADRRVRGAPRRLAQDTPGVPGDSEDGDLFGWSLAMADLAGAAGVPDLVVGAPYEDDDGGGRQPDGQGVTHAGAVTLLRDVALPRTPAGTQFRLPSAEGLFGYALAASRSAGVANLAAGAPGAGAVQLFRGTPGGDPSPLRVLRGPRSYGFSLALAGDDLAIGAPDEGGGTVTVVPLDGPAEPFVVGGGPGDRFGWSVAGAGYGRLLVGAPDRGRTGAVALVPIGGDEIVWFAPGDGTIPEPPSVYGEPRWPHERGVAVDFGSSVG
ncbi:hypothetical protein [Sphaerisporangium corydalis]|uniref:VCBS repeat-containing protein n=1 Tax=Sphaerisporangium corydalis TaxID=1441875 RepID=A0ABV9ECK7_9ACTN|nr:hypothetical protein [Sphaerisporangium corydalis]